MVADELRRQADRFIELQDLAPEISRHVVRTDPAPVRHGVTPASPEPGEGEDEGDDDDEFVEESV